jgi:hypothetical protein
MHPGKDLRTITTADSEDYAFRKHYGQRFRSFNVSRVQAQ